MSTNITLALVCGLLVGVGIYLLMARGIVRAFLGVLLMSNGINLLFLLASGNAGRPPLIRGGDTGQDGMTDPLPQALVLTAIVITLALTGFVLALAYRAAEAEQTDAITDDTEDARVARAGEADAESEVDVLADPTSDDEPADGDVGAETGPGAGATR
ncbi:MAG: Na(+)/H(+) antiporter subunit C [Austwickia sp.]|nr:Na(+)/H(+) antiporter subunit C [Austwickia sp.]